MSTAEDEGGTPSGYDKVPVVVFAHLLPGEIRIILAPGYGMGGAPRDIHVVDKVDQARSAVDSEEHQQMTWNTYGWLRL